LLFFFRGPAVFSATDGGIIQSLPVYVRVLRKTARCRFQERRRCHFHARWRSLWRAITDVRQSCGLAAVISHDCIADNVPGARSLPQRIDTKDAAWRPLDRRTLYPVLQWLLSDYSGGWTRFWSPSWNRVLLRLVDVFYFAVGVIICYLANNINFLSH